MFKDLPEGQTQYDSSEPSSVDSVLEKYEEWKDSYGLIHEPNFSDQTDYDCKTGFITGYFAGLEAGKLKWVSVKDRLPDTKNLTSETVIFRDKNRSYYGYMHINGYWYEDNRYGGMHTPSEVTHWTLLNPPEE